MESGVTSASSASVASALMRHLVEHSDFQAALLVAAGQYILYTRYGATDLGPKGISSEALRAAFTGEPIDSGWLPEGVVRCGSGAAGPFLVRFLPPGKQQLFLTPPGGKESVSLTLKLPALLFAGCQSTYYIWALKSPTYTPTSLLFHAPFPNVYPDGHICFGQNVPPVVSSKTFEQAWQLFLRAPFNADMSGNKSQAFPHDVRQQLWSVAHKKNRYPVRDLVPYARRKTSYSWDEPNKEWRTVQDVVDHFLLQKGEH